MLRVVGLDLSYSGTAVATEEGTARIKTATGETDLQGTAQYIDRMVRIDRICTWLAPHVDGYDLAVVEGYSYASQSAGEHLGELNYGVRAELRRLGIPWVIVSPNGRSKFATGNGSASKDAVQQEVCARLGRTMGTNDEVDAYVMRQMGLAAYDLEREYAPLPKTHTDALTGVQWPTVQLRRPPFVGFEAAPVVVYKPKPPKRRKT